MLNASRRRGSTARADHKRKGFTCRPRHPTMGMSLAVAADASLPSSSASLASTALLISSRSPFSAGAIAGRIKRSPPSVWLAFAGGDLRAKLGLSMPHASYAGIGVEELVVRLRSGAISEERFVAEMVW